MKAKRPSGEFKELKIENSGAEVIRKNGAFQVVESDVRSNFFLHPEFKNIRFRNGRRILEEEKEFYSDYILMKHFRYNEKDQLLEIEIEDHQTFNLPQEKKESIFYSTLINFVALSYKNTFLGKNLVVLFELPRGFMIREKFFSSISVRSSSL